MVAPAFHQVGSYYWPIKDRVTPMVVLREAARIPAYLKHVTRRQVCVQAGGNCGVYAQILAGFFKTVHTFEPDPENWECLNLNITAPNVTKTFAALGSSPGTVETWRTEKEAANYGATQVRPAATGAPIVLLDDCHLPALDFLFLDVEGWETPTLHGAEQTIRRFKPTISLELKGLGAQHGYNEAELVQWLLGLGYQEAEKIGRDIIFTPV